MYQEFKSLTVIIVFLAMAFLCDTGSAAASNPDKPKNVLFLVSDDLNSWLLGDTNHYAGKVVAFEKITNWVENDIEVANK